MDDSSSSIWNLCQALGWCVFRQYEIVDRFFSTCNADWNAWMWITAYTDRQQGG